MARENAYVTYLEYLDCYVMQLDNHSVFYGELDDIEEVCREYGFEMIIE